MKEYTEFAGVYDILMDDVPYDEWAEYVTTLLRENGVTAGNEALRSSMTGDRPIIAELGCGTGSMTRRLAAAGYDMIGIDLSPEMLGVAREKEPDPCADDAILYLCQDMTQFELYGTVAAIVSLCDSMNYLTDEASMLATLKGVANYLDPAGVFIFDLHTEYYYSRILGDNTFYEEKDDVNVVWENGYDPEERLNEYDLTLYIKKETENGGESYTKATETHIQRAWRTSEIRKLMNEAGLKLIACYGSGTHEEPARDEERVYFVAVKKKK